MFLTAEQVKELTDRERCDAQIRMLRAMGIPHIVHPDGHPKVPDDYLERLLGEKKKKEKTEEPDWGNLDA